MSATRETLDDRVVDELQQRIARASTTGPGVDHERHVALIAEVARRAKRRTASAPLLRGSGAAGTPAAEPRVVTKPRRASARVAGPRRGGRGKRTFEERFGVSRDELRRRVSEETRRQERLLRDAERERWLQFGKEFQELWRREAEVDS